MKVLNVFGVMLMLSCSLEARATGSSDNIRGMIKDAEGVPVDAAVISGMDESGKVVFQCISREDGVFEGEMKAGKVQLWVSCLGYGTYQSEWMEVKDFTDVGVISLTAESVELEDVVIVGEKQHASVRLESGRIVYSPKNSAVVAGGSAFDVLKRTPGVFVDGQHNLHVGGKGNVLVMINGKNTMMQQEELVALLRATPAESIVAVEVMQQPSARYDAQGTGGLVNIRLKNHQREEDFYFSANNGLSYWKNLRQNTELSFGYSKDKFSLTGGYSHAVGYYGMEYGMRREQDNRIFDSPTQDTDKRKTFSSRLGMEYRFSDRHLAGAGVNVNALGGPGLTRTTTRILDAATGELLQWLYAENDYTMQKANRYSGNVFYKFTPSAQTEYEVDYDYAWFDGGSRNRQPNIYFSPSGERGDEYLYHSENGRKVYMQALTFNLQHPLWGGMWYGGLKYSSVRAENRYRFAEASGGLEVIDYGQSNDFDYKEAIGAAFLQYQRSWGKKWSVEAGIRAEYTHSVGTLYPLDGKDKVAHEKNQLDWFPSLTVNYQLTPVYALTGQFNTRIDRPVYQNLNPFEYLLDEYSCWRGNPFLQPQKSYEAALLLQGNGLMLSMGYTCLKDFVSEVKEVAENQKLAMTPRNVGEQHRFSVSAIQELSVCRWWNLRYSAVLLRSVNDLTLPACEGVKRMWSGIFSVQSNFNLPWKLHLEMNGGYTTKMRVANAVSWPSGSLDVGLSRKFCKNRLTVNLAVSDVFWTSKWDNLTEDNSLRVWQYGHSESRQLRLNVTYRFGKNKEVHQSKLDAMDRL